MASTYRTILPSELFRWVVGVTTATAAALASYTKRCSYNSSISGVKQVFGLDEEIMMIVVVVVY